VAEDRNMVAITQENGGDFVSLDPAEVPAASSRWRKIRRIALILFVGLGFLWIIVVNWSEVAYQRSRDESLGPPTGYGFLTKGIKMEMSEAQVNRAMSGADRVLPHLYSYNPPWNGYINTYEFGYGPEANLLVGKWKVALVKETIDVYFDPAGHPKKMKIVLNRRGWRSESTVADLERKWIVPSD